MGDEEGHSVSKNAKRFEPIKKRLIDELKGYKPNIDSGDVPKINFAEVRQYLKMEHFDPEVIQKKNSAAAGLCTWVVNIVKYYDIWIDVEPKRIKVQEATEMLDKANGELAIVKEQVAELQAQLDILTEEYNSAEKDKREAVEFAEKGQLKLDLAQRLTAALGSEEETLEDVLASRGPRRLRLDAEQAVRH